MVNMLDEMKDPILEEGRDVNVIAKQIPIKVGVGSTIFEVFLWILGIIPGLVFLFMKMRAKNYLAQLEQKIQHAASQIDNYMEQRVVILRNLAPLVEKSIALDKETFTQIAAYRSGSPMSDEARNQLQNNVDKAYNNISVAVENYPDLRAHEQIAQAMQQNAYLQKEITAAREVYNDVVYAWNRDINAWPTKMIVAARAGYTTRIPFATSQEIKRAARDEVFF